MEIAELEGIDAMTPGLGAGEYDRPQTWLTRVDRCAAWVETARKDGSAGKVECNLVTGHIGAHVSCYGGTRWQQ